MATPTYTPIASITLGSSASSVTFSSIPQTYRDLVLVVDALASSATTVQVRFNNDSSSIYEQVVMRAILNDPTPASFSTSTFGSLQNFQMPYGLDGATKSITKMNIFDYSETDKHKSVTFQFNAVEANSGTLAGAGRYPSTSAVTSVEVICNAIAGSTFALYGIEA